MRLKPGLISIPASKQMRGIPRGTSEHGEGDSGVCGRHGGLLRVRCLASPITYAYPACRLKGPTYESGTRIQAAAGLHHLMGNHFHVMVGLPVASSQTRGPDCGP